MADPAKAPRAGKRDHAARVTASATIVRAALARAEAAGAPRSEPAHASLAVVDRWLAGEPLTAAALDQARAAAHDDNRRWNAAGAPLARSAMWAGTAAGNLCWMAMKERGWQDGDRTIMDAALYTITSALPGGDGAAILAELERMRADALAAALAAPAEPPPKAPARPRLRTIPDLADRVGAVAAAIMQRRGARIDPARRGDQAAVRARLAEHGYPAHPAVLAFDDRWGGMILSRGEEGDDWIVGAFACADGGERGGRARRRLVPVARSPNDVVYFLDAGGQGWGQDTIEEPRARLVATDGDQLIAALALYEQVFADRLRGRMVEAGGRHGARVARALRLPAIREASGEQAAFWGDGKTLVAEVREGKGRTMVAGAGCGRAGELLA